MSIAQSQMTNKRKDNDMKRKMITSLILVMCCAIASIPASADFPPSGISPQAIICDECGPFMYRCTDVYAENKQTHRYQYAGYWKICEYVYVQSYTRRVCDICGNMSISGLHGHGDQGHTPAYCEPLGYSNKLVCSLDGTVYN